MVSSANLPAPPPLEELLSTGRPALFLDFDGTLVELAPTPDSIRPLADMSQRLLTLAERLEHRLALVSGRALADIEKHIGPLPIAGAGSHGADIRAANGDALSPPPGEFPEAIEREMRAFAHKHGIDYEAKPHGGALHYRARPEMEAVVQVFGRTLADDHGWKAQGGKCVVEIVKGDADKASAVHTFMRLSPFAGAQPIFIGDDLTDEAGFAACRQLGSHGILVGERAQTAAGYRLPDVASVHAWLGL
jgi:trehalose 6-phosphate phosphatase